MEYPSGATPLDADELAGLKHPHVETRGELDALEQRNIQSGLRWLRRQRRFGGEELLTEAFTRLLHKNFFGDVWRWAGTFRADYDRRCCRASAGIAGSGLGRKWSCR